MNGTIYDFQALPRLSLEPIGNRPLAAFRARAGSVAVERVGLISNPRSHRNRAAAIDLSSYLNLMSAAPRTRAELRDTLAAFAARRIDLLVIDGGDGTVRDVLTCAGETWGANWPRLAVLPSGKTNALAVDLGVPARWTLDDALAAAARGRVIQRAPIEVTAAEGDAARVRGFLFGAGVFVDATALAQHTHRAGAFNGLAVSLALAWAISSTAFGSARNSWRSGRRMALRFGDDAIRMHGARLDVAGARYIMLASTLHRLPAGLKPFGRPRAGLKTLVVDAPPRRLATSLMPLLNGSETPRLEEGGYHRIDSDFVAVDLDTSFIFDGERFPPGAYTLRRGAPLRFVAP